MEVVTVVVSKAFEAQQAYIFFKLCKVLLLVIRKL